MVGGRCRIGHIWLHDLLFVAFILAYVQLGFVFQYLLWHSIGRMCASFSCSSCSSLLYTLCVVVVVDDDDE